MGRIPRMIAANDTIPPPKLGQQTETQHGVGRGLFGGSYFSGGVGFAPGISETAGLLGGVWPGWSSLLWGTYGTYRAMARHPTIAKSTSDALSPVLGSAWMVDADEDAPEAAKQWVTDNIVRHWQCVIAHAARSVILGNSPFEVVWAAEGGTFVVRDFVPLLPDVTSVMRDDGGRGPFAGIQNGDAKLARAECLYILNRSDAISDEPGDDYGRSRYENFRDTAWTGWLDTARKLAELEDRVSGVIPIIIVPSGGPVKSNGQPYTNADDTEVTFAQLARELLPSLTHPRSKGAVLESPAVGDVNAQTDPAKYKQLSTTVNTLDMGERAGSQGQMLEKLKYFDACISRGMYLSERTTMATEGGTKADAGVHGAIQEHDPESIAGMIAAQVNEQTVRTGLTLNFGADVLRKVRGIKAAPLVDQDAVRAEEALAELTVKDEIAKALAEVYDMDKLIQQAGRPIRKGAKFSEVLDKVRAAAKAMLPGEPLRPAPGAAFPQMPNASGRPMSQRTARAMRTVAGR